MSSKRKLDDSDDDINVIKQLGKVRYLKRKHGKTINETKKEIYNEDFVEKMKQYNLSGKELKFLNELAIVPFHEVPPQHKIEHQAGSRVLSQKERKEFEKIIPIQNGPFTTKEDTQIVKNWIKFCIKHEWDSLRPDPFVYMRFGGRSIIPYLANRIAFVQILARKLPNRTLYSVYHRFRNLNSSHKVCRYSIEEDSMILEHVRNSNKDEKAQFSTLAKLLNRTRMSVWRRYQLLKKQSNKIDSKRKAKKQRLEELEESNNEKNEDILISSSENSDEDENSENLKPKKKEPAKRGRKKKNPEQKKRKEEETDDDFYEKDEDNNFDSEIDEM